MPKRAFKRPDLTLDELLSDPVTRAVMRADRIDAQALRAMLRARLPGRDDRANGPAAPFVRAECHAADGAPRAW